MLATVRGGGGNPTAPPAIPLIAGVMPTSKRRFLRVSTDEKPTFVCDRDTLQSRSFQIEIVPHGDVRNPREFGLRAVASGAYGSFRRVMELPGDVDADKIHAAFQDGVLTIDLPKSKEAQEKVRRIPVKAA